MGGKSMPVAGRWPGTATGFFCTFPLSRSKTPNSPRPSCYLLGWTLSNAIIVGSFDQIGTSILHPNFSLNSLNELIQVLVWREGVPIGHPYKSGAYTAPRSVPVLPMLQLPTTDWLSRFPAWLSTFCQDLRAQPRPALGVRRFFQRCPSSLLLCSPYPIDLILPSSYHEVSSHVKLRVY